MVEAAIKEHPYLPLRIIERYTPEMERLGVSKVARGRGGFLTEYRRVGGRPSRLVEYWRRKRAGFIARHMAQYRVSRGYRQYLALIAWAYQPRLKPLGLKLRVSKQVSR
jgi:hypothetical protein